MSSKDMNPIRAKAQQWLDSPAIDADTKAAVQHMMDQDENELTESFYKDLEFGTGGLRGIMGAGSNRMNIYTVGMATQGLCNYLKREFAGLDVIKVVVGHDCRNNSRMYAQTTADIFTANGIEVFLFEDLRPTPELSFAIRELGCQSGVVITASHNPKEYNGYKAYWDDGAQLTPPHDKNVIAEVMNIAGPEEIKFDGNKKMITILGQDFDKLYLDRIAGLSLNPGLIEKHSGMKIVYTPIHGTGVELVPASLRRYGFSNIINVPEQDEVDGNFPTVVSPNPEVQEALSMAIEKAKETGAELVMATDPDSDRVGIAILDDRGRMILPNGNQTGAILVEYMLSQWKEKGKLTGNEFVVQTVVTSELIADIAKANGVECYYTLTGFKWIAKKVREMEEAGQTYIVGGEESYGYMAGAFVRDKDAVMSCALIAEAAAFAKEQGKSLFEYLQDIYLKYGFYKEALVNVVRKGRSGAEEIAKMMEGYRTSPPKTIVGSDVVRIIDYLERKDKNIDKGTESPITDIPQSNVLKFFLADGTSIAVRPSGTEPKIKYYFSVKDELKSREDYHATEERLDRKINDIISELKLNP